MWILSIKLKSPCSSRRDFTNWSISPATTTLFYAHLFGDAGHCPSHLAITEAKWAKGKVVSETMGPLRLWWFPVPVRKNCICHTHTLTENSSSQSLSGARTGRHARFPHPPVSPRKWVPSLLPECSSVLHMGGAFRCTCLEVTPSVWVCLTSQRSSAMGRAVKYFPSKLWKEKLPGGKSVHLRKLFLHWPALLFALKETPNLWIQVWPIFYSLFTYKVHSDMLQNYWGHPAVSTWTCVELLRAPGRVHHEERWWPRG